RSGGAATTAPPGALLRASARSTLVDARGATTHLFVDHVGSPIVATRDGVVTGARRFSPYGLVTEAQGFVDQRGFTGQDEDATLGLLRFAARFYDPRLGVWASADPAFATLTAGDAERLDEATHRAGYVGGRPLDHVDPLGLTGEASTAKPTPKPAARRVAATKVFGRRPVEKNRWKSFFNKFHVNVEDHEAIAKSFESLEIYDENVKAIAEPLHRVEAELAANLWWKVRSAYGNALERQRFGTPMGRVTTADVADGIRRTVSYAVEFMTAPGHQAIATEFLDRVAEHADHVARTLNEIGPTQDWMR
ncbi:RHS repeat-associated core domain-containing protein, partial [Myxococcota bacterium]|nr:RHS repeat-associated core domain-containing protein [Myxococcota bacterium]